MSGRLTRMAATVSLTAAAVTGGGYALAASSGPSASAAPTFECIKVGDPAVHYIERQGVIPRACKPGFVLVGIGARGPQGPAASDVKGSLTDSVSMNVSAIPTQLQYIGGTILQKTAGQGATNLLQVTLQPGTYLVNANVKFDRSVDAGTGPDTFGYAVLWTGATTSTPFTDFSQGAGTFTTGALSRMVGGTLPNLDVIDAVASGSHVLVVPAGGEVLNLSAFAYNEDESGGPYSGCVGVTGASGCTAADLTAAGSVVVTGADMSIVRVG